MSFVGDIFRGPPKPPAAPDPTKTIEAQAKQNQVTQLTPQGNLVYGTIGEDGEFIPREDAIALQVQETPFQSEYRGLTEGIALDLAGELSGADLTDFRSAQAIESGLQTPLLSDFSAEAQRIEQETYEAGQRRLDPIIQEEREALIQNLADRGIPRSSEAAQRELDRFDLSVSDRQQDLAFNAIEAGRVEQNRLAALTAQLRGQEVNEQLAFANLEQQQRAQTFGEIGSLGGFTTAFQPFNAPTVDAAGIINQSYANQLSRNQIQSANYKTNLGFIGDLASAGGQAAGSMPMPIPSDINLKRDIKPYDVKNGYQRYSFKYNNGDDSTYVGVMAQEIKDMVPDAVIKDSEGYYMVRYDMLGFQMEKLDA